MYVTGGDDPLEPSLNKNRLDAHIFSLSLIISWFRATHFAPFRSEQRDGQQACEWTAGPGVG